MWAVSAVQSAGCTRPGQRQKEFARVPPSQGEPLAPRMPALNTLTPAVPPLSFMNTTRVFLAMPQSSSRASRRPMFSSML